MTIQQEATASPPGVSRDLIEKWRVVPSLPRYEASNLGNVRIRWKQQPLAVWRDPNGIKTVNTYMNGCGSNQRVARLVGEAWCRSFKPHLRTVYRDGDRENCRPSNLKWVSQSSITGKPFSKNPKQPTNNQ